MSTVQYNLMLTKYMYNDTDFSFVHSNMSQCL